MGKSICSKVSPVLSPGHSIISNVSANIGPIIIGEHSKVENISGNFGKVSVGHGSKISLVNNNSGYIFIDDYCEVGSIGHSSGRNAVHDCSENRRITFHYGHVQFNFHSSTPLFHGNAGLVGVGDGCRVDDISGNDGDVSIGKNCKVGIVQRNKGTIKIGDNCKVGEVKGNFADVYVGANCTIKKVSGNRGKLVLSPGSRILRLSGNNPGQINFRGEELIGSVTQVNNNGRNVVQLRPPVASVASRSTPSAPCRQAGTPGTLRKLSKPITKKKSLSKESLKKGAVPHGGLPTAQPEDRPQTCSICLEAPRDLAFKCGHTCCSGCGTQLKNCHVCRGRVTLRLKLFT